MKKIQISKKNFIWFLTGVLAISVFFLLQCIRVVVVGNQPTQNMAKRWNAAGGAAQVSCFFSENASISEDQIIGFEHMLDSKLLEESITVEAENESARLWMDAYSTDGFLSLSRENRSMSVQALGVGGDFFYFHPLKLLDGYYFFGSDINQDFIVIDEDIAWQLFGSNDVEGMELYVGNKLFIVRGVIERDKSRLSKAAGLEKPLAYISFSAMQDMQGGEAMLKHYEIVMPNPVTDYAKGKVQELIGVDENSMVLVENSKRYGFVQGLMLIPKFGIRSMSEKAILYPYWENIARAKEDVNTLFVLLQVPFLLYFILLLLGFVVYLYRHKSWTVGSLIQKLRDMIYEKSAIRQERRLQKRAEKE